MLGSYTILEILLAVAVFLIAGNELIGVLRARRDGLSQNLSRVVFHVVTLLLLVPYVAFAYFYLPLEESGPIEVYGTPTFNWTYLIIGMILTVLAAWEALSMYRARRLGLTSNRTRLISYSVMFIILLVMMGLSVRKWDHYLDRMEVTYEESIPDAEAN